MKYRIITPPPKKKLMTGVATIVISDGSKQVFSLTKDQRHLDFELPDHVTYVYNGHNKVVTFEVLIEYQNKDGTKKQLIRPVPERL